MNNNLQRMQEENEHLVPPELERQVMAQVNHMNVFGRVVELFIPSALQTAARMIGGGDQEGPSDLGDGRRPGSPDEWPDWRFPPGRGGV